MQFLRFYIKSILHDKRVNRSLVNPEMMDTLKEKILRIIVIQEKYKDKEYSAKQLAMDLGTNTRYVSAVINVKFHTNYSCFVNKYRIDEAMSLMVDRRYQKLTMEQISDMVGFSNRQSFYASFYRIMNMSPREYRVKFLEQHPSQKVENQKKDRSSK